MLINSWEVRVEKKLKNIIDFQKIIAFFHNFLKHDHVSHSHKNVIKAVTLFLNEQYWTYFLKDVANLLLINIKQLELYEIEYIITPVLPNVLYHIESSYFFCRSKQMTGFYMKCNTGIKWVKRTKCNNTNIRELLIFIKVNNKNTGFNMTSNRTM